MKHKEIKAKKSKRVSTKTKKKAPTKYIPLLIHLLHHLHRRQLALSHLPALNQRRLGHLNLPLHPAHIIIDPIQPALQRTHDRLLAAADSRITAAAQHADHITLVDQRAAEATAGLEQVVVGGGVGQRADFLEEGGVFGAVDEEGCVGFL